MGHKAHPIGLRLGIHRKWKGNWYFESKNYAKFLQMNFYIENFIKGFFFFYKAKKTLVLQTQIVKLPSNILFIFVFYYRYRQRWKLEKKISTQTSKKQLIIKNILAKHLLKNKLLIKNNFLLQNINKINLFSFTLNNYIHIQKINYKKNLSNFLKKIKNLFVNLKYKFFIFTLYVKLTNKNYLKNYLKFFLIKIKYLKFLFISLKFLKNNSYLLLNFFYKYYLNLTFLLKKIKKNISIKNIKLIYKYFFLFKKNIINKNYLFIYFFKIYKKKNY